MNDSFIHSLTHSFIQVSGLRAEMAGHLGNVAQQLQLVERQTAEFARQDHKAAAFRATITASVKALETRLEASCSAQDSSLRGARHAPLQAADLSHHEPVQKPPLKLLWQCCSLLPNSAVVNLYSSLLGRSSGNFAAFLQNQPS